VGGFTQDAVIRLGIDIITAYELTPYEITVIGRQVQEQRYVEFENIITLAWHTEAFARQKKMPSLKKLLKDVRKKPKKKNSVSDAILKAMAAEKGIKV
jgi:hypothetical protein